MKLTLRGALVLSVDQFCKSLEEEVARHRPDGQASNA